MKVPAPTIKIQCKFPGISSLTPFSVIREKFKDNENYTLAKLDKMISLGAGAKNKGKSMGDAVANTEKIRTWEDHMWTNDQLCQKHSTDKAAGLTQSAAEAML